MWVGQRGNVPLSAYHYVCNLKTNLCASIFSIVPLPFLPCGLFPFYHVPLPFLPCAPALFTMCPCPFYHVPLPFLPCAPPLFTMFPCPFYHVPLPFLPCSPALFAMFPSLCIKLCLGWTKTNIYKIQGFAWWSIDIILVCSNTMWIISTIAKCSECTAGIPFSGNSYFNCC